MEKQRPNPWGDGDRRERELREKNPVEYAQMLLEQRITRQIRELEEKQIGSHIKVGEIQKKIGISINDDAVDLRGKIANFVEEGNFDEVFKGLTVSDIRGPRDSEWDRIRFCQTLIARPDATVRDHYKLDKTGRVVGYKKNTLPDLLSLVHYDESRGEPKAEDVVRAADAMEAIYPELHFDFKQTTDMIEYTATLRVPK
jgi:hypothetical protein